MRDEVVERCGGRVESGGTVTDAGVGERAPDRDSQSGHDECGGVCCPCTNVSAGSGHARPNHSRASHL